MDHQDTDDSLPLAPKEEAPYEFIANYPGFVLVQLRASMPGPSRGSVTIDVRRPSGQGGSLRNARASVDYDSAAGRWVEFAHLCLPVLAGEQIEVRLTEPDGQPPVCTTTVFPPFPPDVAGGHNAVLR